MTVNRYDHEARWAALSARMDAQAARRHAARVNESRASAVDGETRLRAEVDAAVREAVGKLRESAGPAQPEATPEQPPAAPERPLHQLDPEEFRGHIRDTFPGGASPFWGGPRAQTSADPLD